MPSATIIQITRIQNKIIWERYSEERKRLCVKNRGVVNELELFHGCRRTDPLNISNSEEGFDVRHSRGGSWGFANYFAINASYSDKYAYCTPQGEREMLVAKVILGEIFDCGEKKDNTLRIPPVKGLQSAPLNLVNVRYDSISGLSRNSRIYMTYDNNKAYPAYIIKYTS